jgi:hypothetical protein
MQNEIGKVANLVHVFSPRFRSSPGPPTTIRGFAVAASNSRRCSRGFRPASRRTDLLHPGGPHSAPKQRKCGPSRQPEEWRGDVSTGGVDSAARGDWGGEEGMRPGLMCARNGSQHQKPEDLGRGGRGHGGAFFAVRLSSPASLAFC